VRTPTDEPHWEYLVSHHGPNRYDRTLTLRIRARRVHLCARCSGQLLGFVAVLAAWATLRPVALGLTDPGVLVALALAPAPAAFDWYLQSSGVRDSSNALRLVSGALLGGAFAGLIALLVSGALLDFVGGLVIFAAYVGLLFTGLWVNGAWRKVIEEHFPGVALPPAN